MIIKRRYKLLKLRSETIDELIRLRNQTGKVSIDDLILSMIQLADKNRIEMMNSGWQAYKENGVSGG
jgi:hypothetical protein